MNELTADENAAAVANWRLMDADMREFVVGLEQAGMIDGRLALANAVVVLAPDRLPVGDGVQPCIPTRAEREAIEEIRKRRGRA